MVRVVAVDSSGHDRAGTYFVLGAALEVSDVAAFEAYYFSTVAAWSKKYHVDTVFPVIKTKTIVDRIPSYQQRDAFAELIEALVKNPALSRIHFVVGWYDKNVTMPDGKEMPGIQFASKILSQYFPAVALWRYHTTHPGKTTIPSEAWLDNISGKITRAWKYVGTRFELHIAPHGDLTYPWLSCADLLCGHFGRFLPRDKPFAQYPLIAGQWLKDHVHAKCGVSFEAVNEAHQEFVVPAFPYSLQTELHYPHPVVFLHDEVFDSAARDAITESELHALTRKWAHDRLGCVVSLEPHRLPAIVRAGDKIVTTVGSDSKVPYALREMNPTKNIEVLDSTTFLSQVLKK